jgi:hypothetical protein
MKELRLRTEGRRLSHRREREPILACRPGIVVRPAFRPISPHTLDPGVGM